MIGTLAAANLLLADHVQGEIADEIKEIRSYLVGRDQVWR